MQDWLKNYSKNELIDIYNETEELMAIIAKGIATAKNNK